MSTPFHEKSIPDKLRQLANDLTDMFDDKNASGYQIYWEDIENACSPDTLREIAGDTEALGTSLRIGLTNLQGQVRREIGKRR